MNLDNLNKWLTLVANLGVLAGIFFLAYEIRQNTDSLQSQTRATLFAGAQEELWKNMEYPDVTLNMLSTDHELSAEEKIRLDAWLTAAMRAREAGPGRVLGVDPGHLDLRSSRGPRRRRRAPGPPCHGRSHRADPNCAP